MCVTLIESHIEDLITQQDTEYVDHFILIFKKKRSVSAWKNKKWEIHTHNMCAAAAAIRSVKV